jgi:hypothetical protein
MLRHSQLKLLKPTPEVVALGQPDRTVLLTRHFGPAESAVSRLLSDPSQVLATDPASWTSCVRQAYAFFSDALAYFEDGRWHVICWDEMVEFRGPTLAKSGAEVTLVDGRRIALRTGDWTRTDVLQEVERRVHEPILARASAALDTGESVAFGPLVLGPRGLSRQARSVGGQFTRWLIEDADGDDTLLAWGEIGRLVVEAPVNWRLLLTGVQPIDPRLRIGKRGEQKWSPLWGTMGQEMAWWFDAGLLGIPNRTVLLALLCARRPADAKTQIFGLLDKYLPWNPDWEQPDHRDLITSSGDHAVT